MIGKYVLREVVRAEAGADGARVYLLECGHTRRVFPAPAKDSVRSRCHACAGDSPPKPIAEAVEPRPSGSLTHIPAIVYQVKDGLWRAECPFLSFRPCVHGLSPEEAESKLQATIDSVRGGAHAPDIPGGSRFFTVTA